MIFRPNRRPTATLVPFSSRYLTRLFILAGFCVVVMVVLNLSHLRGNSKTKAENDAQESEQIQTAIAPSPFADLGMDVIVSDGNPQRTAEPSQPALQAPSPEEDTLAAPNPQIMQHVLDKTPDLPKLPYYHLLTLAATARTDLLEKHARHDVAFEELWKNPETYRGELIYLKGYVRRLKPATPTDNEFFNPAKVETIYEGYIFTDDSRPNSFAIVMPRVADGMPLGANISENVTFAGYFFKVWKYRAADGTERAAPLLIGQMLTWTPTPHPEGTVHLSAYLAAGFIVLVMTVGGAIWMMNRRNPRLDMLAGEMETGSSSAAMTGLAHLEKLDIKDPIKSLDQIQEPPEAS